jgi:hypothetical protein
MHVVGTQTIDGRKPLKQMNKAELIEILDALELDYEKKMTNAQLVDIINKSGKFNTVKESHTPKVYKDGKRVHPKLGEYRRVIVNSRNPKETQLFFSIGIWTYEFRAGEEVELPKKLIKFIKDCYTIEHVYNPQKVTENGNIGGHETKHVPQYFVTSVEDDD